MLLFTLTPQFAWMDQASLVLGRARVAKRLGAEWHGATNNEAIGRPDQGRRDPLSLFPCAGVKVGAWQVELVEDEVAQVSCLERGLTAIVPRSALPPGAGEGDLVLDGEVNGSETQRARQRIRELRWGRTLTPKPQR